MSESSSPNFEPLTLFISLDRSGSHYLGSFIKALPKNTMLDEVCNEDAVDPATNPISFFGFRQRLAAENPDYSLRHNQKVVTALLDAYFNFLIESAKGDNVAVDIKYGHVHNFELFRWPWERPPFLFAYARRNNIRVIHLSRWNTLEQVISGAVAQSRGIWHATGDRRPAHAADAVEVQIRYINRHILLLNEQKAQLAKWVQDLRCLSLIYEELVHPLTAGAARSRVATFLNAVAPADFQSPFQKVTPPPHIIVKNWSEIEKFCRDNGYAQYLLPLTAPAEVAHQALPVELQAEVDILSGAEASEN